MASGDAGKAALKIFAVAVFGFLLCVGTGALLNGVWGAVWGIGAGIVFWVALNNLLNSK